ncbi:MAG TPA: GDYXXLXY domain-containing protein, partial [Chroococcidiopsis sp.]
IAVSGDRPTDLPSNQVALKGSYEGGRVIYGLESYYIPEDERIDINSRISSLQSGTNRPDIVVETKVNDQGNATPLQFWLGDRPYKF